MHATCQPSPIRARPAPASAPPAEAMDSAVTSAGCADHARPDFEDLEPALGQVAATLGLDRLAGHQTAAPGWRSERRVCRGHRSSRPDPVEAPAHAFAGTEAVTT